MIRVVIMQADREWKLRKKQCETQECLQLPVHERSNCVNECTSSSCFKEVYAAEPVRRTLPRDSIDGDGEGSGIQRGAGRL